MHYAGLAASPVVFYRQVAGDAAAAGLEAALAQQLAGVGEHGGVAAKHDLGLLGIQRLAGQLLQAAVGDQRGEAFLRHAGQGFARGDGQVDELLRIRGEHLGQAGLFAPRFDLFG